MNLKGCGFLSVQLLHIGHDWTILDTMTILIKTLLTTNLLIKSINATFHTRFYAVLKVKSLIIKVS